ncbi:2-polyprenylphenol 6-hydroxylase [Marivibrio halodurans]|uniref:2-polyprenylphenol 6-hydroxylase n=2 Tax=Marivibrio halodurans TaxID=2039722 RepID=A0A8J7SNJ7_9PROT|nr:2-polyprenylphenol 6-hydroxylase [Marivibrio halodurans]
MVGIVRILARHDALWPLDPVAERAPAMRAARAIVRRLWGRPGRQGRPGERLADALTALGPTYVKLGQALSVRADLVGEAVAQDLSRLQDRLDPFPFAEARRAIEAELGGPLERFYDDFEAVPVAAASIAQVHFARLKPDPDRGEKEGAEVAVKVLRPDIERRFARDIALFHWLATLVERMVPSLRRLKPVAVVDTFRRWIETEMDLRLEGAAASELRENCEDDEGFHVVRVDWERTGQRVLTIERLHGCRIDDLAALKAGGHDVKEILRRSATVFFLQVFRDGFFHADMHPGNMFVAPDGTLCPVDFGIMGRVDRRTRFFLADILVGFLNRDYRRVADTHFEFGVVPPSKSRDEFMQALRAIGEPLLDKPLAEISIARLLSHLFRTTERFEMETQPDLLLLQKTMLVAEGVGRKLDPEVNMWLLARPMIEDWVIANRGPEARVIDGVRETVGALERLPATLRRAEETLERLARDGARTPRESGGSVGRAGGATLWLPAIFAVLVLLLLVEMM